MENQIFSYVVDHVYDVSDENPLNKDNKVPYKMLMKDGVYTECMFSPPVAFMMPAQFAPPKPIVYKVPCSTVCPLASILTDASTGEKYYKTTCNGTVSFFKLAEPNTAEQPEKTKGKLIAAP